MKITALVAILGLAAASLAQDTPAQPAGTPGEKFVPAMPLMTPAQAADADQKAHEAAAQQPVYDEKADGAKQIAAALARASADHKRVLVQWGANWCSWCRLLHATFETNPAINKELQYHYEVVYVDIGKWDKHMDLAKQYGADLKGTGVPYLTVLDGDGKAIANQETGALELKGAKPAHDPEKVMAFLRHNELPPLIAKDVLAEGLKQAKADGKLVFLHFGAPWCGWCHKLEGWMARPDVAPLLAKAFVSVKIDTDRDTGGKELKDGFKGAKDAGIPWFAFLDAEGKVVADSNSDKGNIGYPAKGPELDHFIGMLRSAGKHLTPQDIAQIRESLEKQ